MKYSKCQMLNLREFFFEKKKLVSNDSELSNSARNGKKKFGGRWRFSAVVAVQPPFFLKMCKIYVKIRLFSFLTYVLRLKPSLKITDYMKVAKLPPPLRTCPSGDLLIGIIIFSDLLRLKTHNKDDTKPKFIYYPFKKDRENIHLV